MKLKTLDSVDLKNKTVLYRAPYDIELQEINGVMQLTDDMRIRATVPTLRYLLEQSCKIVILTYVGRPDGKVVETLRTTPHARLLSTLLGHPVTKVDDCIGKEVNKKITEMKPREILMLENVRFYGEEMIDDDAFAQKLCIGKDLVVFDGFPQAHRMHASTTGILRHLPSVAGLYLEHEVEMLSKILDNPVRPFIAIIGGAKISDKVDAINNLLKITDKVLIGGAMANVFLKAQGRVLGSSFIEDIFVDEKKREKRDWVLYAKDILATYSDKIVCPTDIMISDNLTTKIIDITKEGVPDGWQASDIGPETQEHFSEIISQSKTIFMNGPMGKSTDERFSSGSQAIFSAIKDSHGETTIAGGDTIDAVRTYRNLDEYSHISLAGGATLEFLAGKTLPALVPLMQES